MFFKNTLNRYKATVVCVVDFKVDDDNGTNGEVTIVGHVFRSMQPLWDFGNNSLNYSKFHSYVVGEIEGNTTNWKGSEMIGKGTALHLNLVGEGNLKGTEGDQRWVVHLLDHCLP